MSSSWLVVVLVLLSGVVWSSAEQPFRQRRVAIVTGGSRGESSPARQNDTSIATWYMMQRTNSGIFSHVSLSPIS